MSLFYYPAALALCLVAGAKAQILVNGQPPGLQQPIVASSNQSFGCSQACAILQDALTHNTYSATRFAESGVKYFSAHQQEFVPECVTQPGSSDGVSQVLHILREQNCPFAVKSGGHSAYPGASTLDGGAVIDLSRLNSIQVSDDESAVSVGTGSTWTNVYSVLEKHGLLAVGGRAGSVGVGGFVLGGGISFLSRRHGWALDNVRNFEVVLANGSTVNASQATHPDLYFALRGGGNNFGIVTRFDLNAYRYNSLWGGTTVFTLEDLEERRSALGLRNDFEWSLQSITINFARTIQRAACHLGFGARSHDVINAFVEMASDEQTDPSAHIYTFLSWVPLQRVYLAGSTVLYSKPETNPPVFRNLTSLQSLYSTYRVSNMSDFTTEVESMNPLGMRQAWDTATFKVNAELISQLWDIFLSEVDLIKTIPGTLAGLNLQLLTKDEIQIFSANGGNSLGINKEDGPLFLFTITIMYENARDDETMSRASRNIISKGTALGKEMGLWHRFLYQNYAGKEQEVFEGYGPENRARLLQIQQRYDPQGVFKRLQPGYFKV